MNRFFTLFGEKGATQRRGVDCVKTGLARRGLLSYKAGLKPCRVRYFAPTYYLKGEPDMEISELRAAISNLTARIEQIRDWL